jgi:ribonuclease R
MKLSTVRRRDPYLERELKRYENPLPSREYILQVLEEQGRPVPFEELRELLDIDKLELDAFPTPLAGDGTRSPTVAQPQRLIHPAGTCQPDRRARRGTSRRLWLPRFPDDGSEDLSLEARQMTKVLHRDRALVRVIGVDRRGRREGVIVEVLETGQ